MRYTYILYCSDQTYYTGITTDLDRRLNEHNTSTKGAKYTRNRRPCTLVRSHIYQTRSQASKQEYYIKQLSKIQKVGLISQSHISN